MDVFVRNLPPAATNKQVEAFFKSAFAEYGIEVYHCDKWTNKPIANITVLDVPAAQRFLDIYGVPTNSPAFVRSNKCLKFNGKPLRCSKSREEPSQFSIQALAYAASEKARKATLTTDSQRYRQNAKITRFAISSIQCGYWDYERNELAFMTQYSSKQQGTISIGHKEALILLGGEHTNQVRIQLSYNSCNHVVLGQYNEPAITFSLKGAPKFYAVEGEDAIATALLSLTLGASTPKQKTDKTRVTGIDQDHVKITGTCFVYRLTLSDCRMMSIVRDLFRRNSKAPPQSTQPTRVIRPQRHITAEFIRLDYQLTDQSRYARRPLSLLYQLERLAKNAVLPPQMVIGLLPTVADIHDTHGIDAALSSLRKFYRHVPFAGPDIDAIELSLSALQRLLKQYAETYDQYKHSPENPYELTKRHTHINLIHKVVVTPCGLYLHGPEPEPTNRVLRRYSHNVDNFTRVVFQDEDGNSVRYDPRASHDLIFHQRFKGVLDTGALVAGRMFGFLGFSHSSLRSQSCWFMSRIFAEGTLKFPSHILKELGDFTNIRIPAKCAARIGQNFTDTNATIDLQETDVGELAMVQRGGYDFSDGVGTISRELLRRVWTVYGQRRLLKPTAIQVRYKGFKGMVALDSRLKGAQILLRDNMKKFEAPNDIRNLEVRGAAFKPLPMILNRSFIKIFEDLGMNPSVFQDLQDAAVDRLRQLTQSSINTSSFLEEKECAKATRLPTLVRQLGDIGLDYRQDSFLYSVVEMVVVTNLRDIKYRGRIPVDQGYTLYGIMDETGELKEGEVFVCTQ